MKGGKLIGFNPQKIAENMKAYAIEEQSRRLVEYARNKINTLGEKIAAYHGAHNMDAEGNLLDSLCWGVCYDGQIIGSGFYREQTASKPSRLHAFYGDDSVAFFAGGRRRWKQVQNASSHENMQMLHSTSFDYGNPAEPVNGHALAEDYIRKAASKSKKNQWLVFFAILAPYWGYWEKGFTLVHGWSRQKRYEDGFQGSTFMQFSVMSEFYDGLKSDLSPAKVRQPHIHVEKYASKSLRTSARKNNKNWKRLDNF